MSQPLRGLVAQGMDGRKVVFQGATYQFPPGSYTFRVPKPGLWKFIGWAAGGSSVQLSGIASGSGAYFEISRRVDPSQPVALVVGAHTNGTGGTTSVTFANGVAATATGGASSGAGGSATGGDINLSGSAEMVAGAGTGGGAAGSTATFNGGGGAPANLPFRGGAGGAGSNPPSSAISPGGGGPELGASDVSFGGDGLVIAYFVEI